MRYIIDLSAEDSESVQRLLRDGRYSTVQEFVSTAIQNQLYLEQQEAGVVDEKSHYHAVEEFNELKLLERCQPEEVHTVEEPTPEKLDSTKPIWGLANRIFPLKITLRVLTSMLKNNGKYVQLNDLTENAFKIASNVGVELKRTDRRMNLKRGEKLSDALPTSTKNEGSKIRFASQFVGRIIYSTGLLSGAPSKLKFVNIIGNIETSQQIGITRYGLEFALMKNPIIDEKNYQTALSMEEKRFLLQHILENIPAEAQGIALILSEIARGNTKPTQLNDVIRSCFNYNDVNATTVRVGLTSRMVEVGLVERSKTGLKINYAITELGNKMLQKFSTVIANDKHRRESG